MAYNSPETREMTPQEHLNQAAANLAGASDELSQTSAVLYQRRADLNVAEHAAMDAQASFDVRVCEFRQLLDQYGLTVSVPQPEKASYR